MAQDDYTKENAQDFALWKSAKPEDEAAGAAWESPWGRTSRLALECRPWRSISWARRSTSTAVDGSGLPHHEDEIAQSEAATGATFSRFWCHGAFLLTEGTKMAKRLGNVTTVQGMREAHISAAAVRHFVFNTHYRKELNLSEDALEASMNAVRRVSDFADRLASATGGTAELGSAADAAVADVERALFDDLNAPNALAGLFTFIAANASWTVGVGQGVAGAGAGGVREINGVDIVPERTVDDPDLVVGGGIAARRAAREAGILRIEFARVGGEGVVIEDGPGGTKRKPAR